MKLILNNIKFPVYASLIGLIATLWKYQFGVGDQLDHLLFVYKAMDPSFLKADPYVSLSSHFSVRFYFAETMAFLARFTSVETVFFTVTILVNVIVALYTYLTAEAISKSPMSALIAAVLVMTLTTINMGDVFTIYAKGLAPDRIAFALILMATYALLKGKTLPATLFLGIASLFHILMGFVIGSILLFSWHFLLRPVDKNNTRRSKIASYYAILLLFASATLAPMFLSSGATTSDNELIEIYSKFRVPHHLLASTIFANGIGWRSLAFLTSTALSYYLLKKDTTINKVFIHFIGCIMLLLIALCLAGYLFTEVFPCKYGVMLQAFRYLTYFKWFSLMLTGIYLGKLLLERHSRISAFYLLFSLNSPFVLCASFLFEYGRTQLKNTSVSIIFQPLIWLIFCLLYFVIKNHTPETMVLILLFLLSLSIYFLQTRYALITISLYLIFIVLNGLVFSNLNLKQGIISDWLSNNYRPVISFNQTEPAILDLCKFAKTLPEDALFLTPPKLIEIRTIGNRASLVCFKTVPFKPADLVNWKIRLDDCYGRTIKQGFPAEDELEQNYHFISDAHLVDLQVKYGLTHAVLFSNTPTQLNVIYQNDIYKVVKVSSE